jgi:hypothetical protein
MPTSQGEVPTMGLDVVAEWVKRYLANGPRWSADLISDGEEIGFGEDRIKRAKKKLKGYFQEGRNRNFSRWMSPSGVRRLSCRSPGWCPGLVG